MMEQPSASSSSTSSPASSSSSSCLSNRHHQHHHGNLKSSRPLGLQEKEDSTEIDLIWICARWTRFSKFDQFSKCWWVIPYCNFDKQSRQTDRKERTRQEKYIWYINFSKKKCEGQRSQLLRYFFRLTLLLIFGDVGVRRWPSSGQPGCPPERWNSVAAN